MLSDGFFLLLDEISEEHHTDWTKGNSLLTVSFLSLVHIHIQYNLKVFMSENQLF